MMRISNLIQTLTEVLANYGDKEVALINDTTGEVRFVESITVNEFADEVILDHVSYGEAFADDEFEDEAWIENIAPSSPNFPFEDAEFFIIEADTSMTDEEFLQALALFEPCDGCVHSNQFTLDDVASCNCCENYSYYTPKSRY